MTAPVPRVSVLMCVWNGARHLTDAVDSIRRQSFGTFEFVIVDDASSDETPALLAGFSAEDDRLRVLRNDRNLGLSASLNAGLDHCRGDIVVRMDADDVAMPVRIERLVAFLDARPDHLFVGSSYRQIDDAGRPGPVRMNAADAFGVRWLTRFRQPVAHPTLAFRRRMPDGEPIGYDATHRVAQDAELIARLAGISRGAVLRDVLMQYRTHEANASSLRNEEQLEVNHRVASAVLARDLPPAVAAPLSEFLRSYLLREPPGPGAIEATLGAMAEMLRLDIAARPDLAPWLRRQTAGLLAEAYLRRATSPAIRREFFRHGARYMIPLVLRGAETVGLMPPFLHSAPDPGAG